MELNAIDTRSLTDRAVDNLEQYIAEQGLKPGTKIPNEFELAKMLSVGRSTIREAIKILVSKNVLEIRRGAGTFVGNGRNAQNGQIDSLGLNFENADELKLAIDMAKVRLLIEPQMAYEAAQYAMPEDIAELRRLEGEVSRLLLSGVDYSEPDSRFHTKLCSISGNLVIPKLLPIVALGMISYAKMTGYHTPRGALQGHKDLVEAISNHNSQLAYNIMYEHVNSGIITLQKLELARAATSGGGVL